MAGGVVIVVPTQGSDVAAFEASALQVGKAVYGGKATIVRTTVSATGTSCKPGEGTCAVDFKTRKGAPFSWDPVLGLSRVLTISHSFSCDGPNLAYHAGGFQPWGSGDSCSELSPDGKAFWGTVGKAMAADGRILLLGCFMGGGEYAGLVAAASGRTAFAAKSLFAAGNAETAIRYVKAIEAGKVPAPMKRFAPPAPAK
jgi:hypothetical protein